MSITVSVYDQDVNDPVYSVQMPFASAKYFRTIYDIIEIQQEGGKTNEEICSEPIPLQLQNIGSEQYFNMMIEFANFVDSVEFPNDRRVKPNAKPEDQIDFIPTKCFQCLRK